MTGKTVLITGATSGIGLEFAKIFAKNGYNLVIVARNAEKLESTKSALLYHYPISIISLAKDLSSPHSPQEIYNDVKQRNIFVDILINNAGFGNYGKFAETDVQKELQELQVNIVSLTYLTKLFVKDMVAQKEGKILNLASTAAFVPGPFMAVYFASKAYVLSFSEAIASELQGTGVTVTALCPGPTETQFAKTADAQDVSFFKNGLLSAERVAQEGYEGLMSGKRIVIVGLKNKLLIFALRFVPRSVAIAFLRSEQEKK